ncbi:MAG: hypothetical protein AB8E15_13720 [Bdellovibrionales bacterium]
MNEGQREIEVFIPFTFLEPLDPSNINTVGNQLLAEHLFASITEVGSLGQQVGSFATTKIDSKNKTLTIFFNQEIKGSSGKPISIEEIKLQIESKIKNSQHLKFEGIFASIRHIEKSIEIKFKEFPSNILSFLRLPEMLVLDPAYTPINFGTHENLSFTGPFSLTEFNSKKAVLKKNIFFPKELRANLVEKITINVYENEQVSDIIESVVKGRSRAAYLYSIALEDKDFKKLESRKISKIVNTSDWLVLSFMGEKLAKKIKEKIRKTLTDSPVPKVGSKTTSSVIGVDHSTISVKQSMDEGIVHEYLEVAILRDWMSFPYFKKLVEGLKKNFNVKIIVIEKKNIMSLYSGEYDLSLAILGMSKSDHIAHFNFLKSVNSKVAEVFSDNLINKIATEFDLKKRKEATKLAEQLLLDKFVILPLATFPGINIFSTNMIPDQNLYGSWGVRTWQLEIND